MAKGISFFVTIRQVDWKKDVGGWHCSALSIPASDVGAMYVDGVPVDRRLYKVDKATCIIRPEMGMPNSASGNIIAQVNISGSLKSATSAFLATVVTALIALPVGGLTKGVLDYSGVLPPTPRYGDKTQEPISTSKPRANSTYPGKWGSITNEVEWRIKSIEKRSDRLTMTIQVRNTNKSSTTSFPDFKRQPLAIIDANGSYYEMMNTSDPPGGVEVGFGWWVLQGGRMLDLVSEFQPLPQGVTEGKVLYKSNNHAEPLGFGLTQ